MEVHGCFTMLSTVNFGLFLIQMPSQHEATTEIGSEKLLSFRKLTTKQLFIGTLNDFRIFPVLAADFGRKLIFLKPSIN